MFQTILVPLDGSFQAEAALATAARIARRTGATLVLVRVIIAASENQATLASARPSMILAIDRTDLVEASTYLERVSATPELMGIPVKTTVQEGPPAPTMLAVAASSACDLIVLAGSTGWAMSGVAEKITLQAPIPVLVLREQSASQGSSPAEPAQPLRMLIPLDGSASAQAALEPGAALLSALAAPGQKVALHLARVLPPPSWTRTDVSALLSTSNALERAKQFLRQTKALIQEGVLAPVIAQQQIPITWSVLLDEDVAGALVRVAEQGVDTKGAGIFGECQLITMATHGRAGVQRWVMGSTAERVLAATTRPVLVVHPQAQAAWRAPRDEQVPANLS